MATAELAGVEAERNRSTDYLLLRGDAKRIPLADRSVDLILGSPPYVDARLYLENGEDLGIARHCLAWVDWMIEITLEAQRISRGPVLWVAAGKTKGRNYQPACEGLMWEWWKRGGDCQLYRPCYWHRVGIPGSGGKDWFRADIEYVMCFKRPGPLAWSDNTAMGHVPKWAPGGDMSHRVSDGTRVNQWGGNGTSSNQRRKDGTRQKPGRPSHETLSRKERGQARQAAVEAGLGRSVTHRDGGEFSQTDDPKSWNYVPPTKANPGNLIKGITVGGGQMGNKLAHVNEAPFPEALAEYFIRSLCPPGGVVLDPFSGSGTTASVACRTGRRGIGLDLRRSQCELGQRRIIEDLAKPPMKIIKKRRPAAPKEYLPLFDRRP